MSLKPCCRFAKRNSAGQAKLLGLTSRQVRRLEAAHLREGAAGLVSKKRGRRSNNSIKAAVQTEAMALVADRYGDFGPTLAAEKLVELHGLAVSRETLRKWMADAGLWTCPHEESESCISQEDAETVLAS